MDGRKGSVDGVVDGGGGSTVKGNARGAGLHAQMKDRDATAEFDVARFVDMDMDGMEEDGDARSVTMEDGEPDEEFGLDVDEDMLMDL